MALFTWTILVAIAMNSLMAKHTGDERNTGAPPPEGPDNHLAMENLESDCGRSPSLSSTCVSKKYLSPNPSIVFKYLEGHLRKAESVPRSAGSSESSISLGSSVEPRGRRNIDPAIYGLGRLTQAESVMPIVEGQVPEPNQDDMP